MKSLPRKSLIGLLALAAFAVAGHGQEKSSSRVTAPVLSIDTGTWIVRGVAISPDGKRIVTGSSDGYVHRAEVKVWDAHTGKELLCILNADRDHVWSVAFSPDGKRIVSSGSEKTIRVWDSASGKLLLSLQGHAGSVKHVVFSLDGKRIVSGGGRFYYTPPDNRPFGEVKVWDAITGKELLDLRGHAEAVHDVAISGDGKRIVSGSYDRTVKVWDAQTGKEALTLQGHWDAVSCVAISADGKRIVSGGWDRKVVLWDAETGKELLALAVDQFAESVAFHPDGKRFVSGHVDGTLKLWDGGTGREVAGCKAHTDSVNSVAFSLDGERCVSGSSDGWVRVWGLKP
jgi:WD40 repeat protein